mgnify:CR=1 FL=1
MIDWKNRYAELVEQLDRQQTRSRKRQALLTEGLKSSARLARGLDKRVDKSLLALQALLRQEKLKNVDLAVAIETLDKQSEQSLADRNKKLKRAAVAIKKISAQTRSLSISSQTHQLLKQIEQELDGNNNQLDQLPDQLEALMVQHRSAMRQSKKRSGRGIWRQWFSNEQDGEEESHKIAPAHYEEDEDDEDNESESDELNESDEDIRVSSDDEATRAAAHDGRRSSSRAKPAASAIDLRGVIRSQFATLLQQLGRTDSSAGLQSRLASKLSVNDIADLTTEVCAVSMDTIQQERQVFYSTVKRMNSRIGVSMNQIDACRAIEEGTQTSNAELHRAIQTGCSDIEASLQGATSLEELKLNLAGRMDAMKAALATHESQTARQDTNAALDTLSQQMMHVQDMSRAALFQMDTQAKEVTTDRDTGLPNRAAFRLTAQKIIQQSRQSNSSISIAVCMLDQYQKLTEGAEAAALAAFFAALADVYRQMLRDSDRIFRLGENEFVFLLPGSNCQAAASLLDGLRQAIAKTAVSKRSVTVSMGIAEYNTSDTAESALARAKRACAIGSNSVNVKSAS